jgi:2,3-bisphosphoglycerate-independent phosphoglycerate mutase
MQQGKAPTVLIILDGFGHREDPRDNAIAGADTPTWDRLWREAPHTLISGSGVDVGLPEGQMGNSEVGHMSLGSGRVVYQSISRIDRAIGDGSFDSNPAYCGAIDAAVARGGAVHVLGLLSPGGVHSHERQLFAALRLAAQRGAERIYLHAFLDGRDTPPRSAAASLDAAEACFRDIGRGRIATVTGRYYAMDRDQRWDRVEPAYRLLTEAVGAYEADSAGEALAAAYARDESDEFVAPTRIGAAAPIDDGDAVLFMNFRADRARQMTRALVDDAFDGFERRRRPRLAGFVMTTEYAAGLDVACAFPPQSLDNVLGAWIAQRQLTQLRIAETEKYAHVTFFFSGGREEAFDGESRVSGALAEGRDLRPETGDERAGGHGPPGRRDSRRRFRSHRLQFCQWRHGRPHGELRRGGAGRGDPRSLPGPRRGGAARGPWPGAGDRRSRQLRTDGRLRRGQAHTQHTTERVPLVYIGDRVRALDPEGGILADVAPTILDLMALDKPAEMTGHSLVSER